MFNEIFIKAEQLLEKAWGGGIHHEEANRLSAEASDLVKDIDTEKLDDDQFKRFLSILNGSFDNERGFNLAVSRCKNSQDQELCNTIEALAQCSFFHDEDKYPKAMDQLMQLNIGSDAQWYLKKAEWYQMVATGEKFEEIEWMPGYPIKNKEALITASKMLEAAVECGGYDEKYLAEYDPSEWELDTWQELWNELWEPILELPEYAHLRSENIKGSLH